MLMNFFTSSINIFFEVRYMPLIFIFLTKFQKDNFKTDLGYDYKKVMGYHVNGGHNEHNVSIFFITTDFVF
jgi:hypothetical protein